METAKTSKGCLFASLIWRHLSLFLAMTAGVCWAAGAPVYPLKQSSSHRFLTDQNNRPFLIMGDSPQALFVNLSDADAESFFADRAAKGFNTLWINLLCATYTGGRADGSTFDGLLPFTAKTGGSYDLTTPNPAYFARVDRMIAAAGAHGLMVLLDPAETGSWLDIMRANGTNRCRQYGQFLGARYGGVDNILWMSGNDFQDWRNSANDALVLAVAKGIQDEDVRHLHTIELDYFVSSSLDDANWAPVIGLNATYTYYPTYAQLLKDYNRASYAPNFMVEANYEFEHDFTGQWTLRRQEYWSMLSGAAGQLYGNGYTWPFLDGWQTHLDTAGAEQFGLVKRLFEPRAWYDLVPDQTHVVLTAGNGTFASGGSVNNSDYATAALTSDGTFAAAYLPTGRTITIDSARFAREPIGFWYDPTSGETIRIPPPPGALPGPRSYTSPGPNHDGDGDWVLVLETNPSDIYAPTVVVTAPAAGQDVGGIVELAANATDDQGILSVQFEVDGAKVGESLFSPPFTVNWNTTAGINGPHTITALATDNFLNTAISDPVTVAVHNILPAPPTNGLAAAFAFDQSGGTAAIDTSGNGNQAVLHGAGFGPGENGRGLIFDGVNNYAEAPDSPSLDVGGTGLTIAFWARVVLTPGGSDYVVAGKPWFGGAMTSPFYQYGVEYSNSGAKTFDFYFGSTGGVLHGPFRMQPATGVWTYVAFTYDGSSTVKGYLDGVEQLSEAAAGSIEARGNSLRLGVDGAYAQFYKGGLDDLRIYNRALSARDIQSTMQVRVTSAANHPPAIDSVAVDGEGLHLTFESVPGELYQLEYALDLSAPAWLPSGSVITGTGGRQPLVDASAATPVSRFYRVSAIQAAGF